MTGYTVKEAAELMGRKEASIRQMISKKTFPVRTYTSSTGRRLISKDGLDEYLDEDTPTEERAAQAIVADVARIVPSTSTPGEPQEPSGPKTNSDLREQRANIEKILRANGSIV